MRSQSDAFLCSNGAFCTWNAASSSFSCVGGTGTVDTTSSSGAGPSEAECPGATLHEGHYDCSNGAFCEEVDGAWLCEGGSSSPASGGEACVVHGGHTHGDWCVARLSTSSSLLALTPPLARSSSQCNGIDLGEYNMDLHIVALLCVLVIARPSRARALTSSLGSVVFVSSLVGVLLPLVCAKALRGTVFSGVFFAAKYLCVTCAHPSSSHVLIPLLPLSFRSGTGVIIATAFVHLLFHAFIMFSNACLGELAFEPAAAAIAMGPCTLPSLLRAGSTWLTCPSSSLLRSQLARTSSSASTSPSCGGSGAAARARPPRPPRRSRTKGPSRMRSTRATSGTAMGRRASSRPTMRRRRPTLTCSFSRPASSSTRCVDLPLRVPPTAFHPSNPLLPLFLTIRS